MGTLLNIISRTSAMLKKLFNRAKPAPAPDEHAEMLKVVSKAEEMIYKSIVIQLKNDPAIAKYGTEVRLLHRRLAQYERMRSHASLPDQLKAMKTLEKQWRKVESISHRKNKGEDIKTVPGSSEPKNQLP